MSSWIPAGSAAGCTRYRAGCAEGNLQQIVGCCTRLQQHANRAAPLPATTNTPVMPCTTTARFGSLGSSPLDVWEPGCGPQDPP